MSHSESRVLVIGAGIAGLAAGRSLLTAAREAGRRLQVTILEAEAMVCTQASGRNAAIFRPLETDLLLVQAAARTAELLRDLQKQSDARLLDPCGFLMLDRQESRLSQMVENCRQVGLDASFLNPEELPTRFQLPLTHRGSALFCGAGGELAPHEIGQALSKDVRRRGAELTLQRRATRLLFSGSGACVGAELNDGTQRHADITVLCAGAASGPLALQCGLPLPLLPLQRHLAILQPNFTVPQDCPAIWSLDPEVYFRREPGGFIVSPCDETPRRGGPPQANIDALAPLAARLRTVLPALAEAQLRNYWACIRTKAVDGRPVIGHCRHTKGLAYFAGLGGFGMSCALGLSELLAAILLGARAPASVSPERLQLPALPNNRRMSTESVDHSR